MKKLFLILFVLMLAFPAFSCYSDSVQIFADNNVEGAVYSLLARADFNSTIFNNSVYYYADNDSSMLVRINNESITFQSHNPSTNWTRIVFEELEWLRLFNATSLSSEEIIVISSMGCCGYYSSLEGSFKKSGVECSEELVMPVVDNKTTWFAVIIALVPWLVISALIAKKEFKKYLVLLIGGAGWFTALLLRSPILNLISGLDIIGMLLLASLLAGVFEELGRYLFLKYFRFCRDNPILFGIGWGFFENLVTYSLLISLLLFLNQAVTFTDALPGAFERLVATGIHVGLTLIVFKSLKDRKYLVLAVFLHFFSNIVVGITAFVLLWNVWVVEFILFIIMVAVIGIGFIVNKEVVSGAKKRRKSISNAKKR